MTAASREDARRHVVVVGAGPAGLAAAAAALAAGARVTLVDAAERPGGQYHRTLAEEFGGPHDGGSPFARLRRRVLGHPRCTWRAETSVWALERPDPEQPGPPLVHTLTGPADGNGRRRRVLTPDALVLAPGAHDRVLPFPGWDLPGVYAAGAAQALVKGERLVIGDAVLLAGTGPFLLPVAASLLAAGAGLREVLEANPAATVARGWARRPWELTAQPGKAAELARYATLLARHRVPYRTGRTVIEARGEGRVEEAVTARLRPDWSVVPGTERTVAVDALCVGHGFSPQLELPLAAGCTLLRTPAGPAGEFVAVDGDQLTSVPGVYAAGEITGIAGAPAARTEGALAGWLAAGGEPAAPALRRVRRNRDRGRAFAARLAAAHPVGAAWPGWLRSETVICRCEETDYGALCRAAADEAGAAPRVTKLATRAGLGPCQARICGPIVAELTTRLRGAPPGGPAEGLPSAAPHRRPLAQPIRLGELARTPDAPDTGTTDPSDPTDPSHPSEPTDSKESTA
ncbi:FAD-dependent oxidoreductase [Streptomyces niger]|uniref:FAD-dependent oxidoreductase n=1 Tax=Streptomyces niger TaxID=66373 RepID=UPI00069A320A|nr:FAD-dependent oxidoreductase [Streptomyces niger]